MRRPERARHTVQLDLFHPICPAPDWRRLPAEVREKAMHLMARLLRSSLQTEVARRLVDRARSRRTAPTGPGDEQQNLFLSMT